tara:strand:- start:219 stop:416 length:198 start_codon:yes stop_codon:yes gene_type:complete
MSQSASIHGDLSTEAIKAKLTLEERAQLLVDILDSCGYEEYEILDDNGTYVRQDIQAAMKALEKY